MTNNIFSTEDLEKEIKLENKRLKREYGKNYPGRLNIGLWDTESRLKERLRLHKEVEKVIDDIDFDDMDEYKIKELKSRLGLRQKERE